MSASSWPRPRPLGPGPQLPSPGAQKRPAEALSGRYAHARRGSRGCPAPGAPPVGDARGPAGPAMLLETQDALYVALELVIAALSVAGNVLVCAAVGTASALQTPTNYFLVSLATADVAVGLFAIPFAITISLGFCTDFYGCLFLACFVLVLTQSSIFSLMAVAVDRYLAVCVPLR
ncbi:adenosine receptor A2b [Piliocolobus tephrosceles]|uniref:adenosine receptor A2b n=1 Tax=Piliocolobus tephrosceles TaxID=591936 RepID=UPI000E6B2AE0|nr:adenosine receptor A2b [Piliocolobus tephrosceles]